MAVRLIPLNDRVLKDDGAPASDGSYKFYLAGSTTPVAVYSDRGLTSSLGSSVAIDAEGYPTYVNVWGADDVSYKIGIQATGYNDGVEKFFDYVAVATSAVVDNSDATPAFKNLLNNGGPSNWTGGTSFSNISGSAAAVEIADDWFFSQNGTASNAISRQTGDGQTARYAMRVGRPAASVSVEALRVYQALPTDNAYQCRGKTITVSFSLKKGADFSGGSVGILIATGTTEGESGNLMATGGWGGFVTALSTTQAPSTTSTRYQFSAALQSSIKEAGLQLSYTPTGTAGTNDWIQIEDVQWEIASAATDFAARPEPVEFLLANLSPFARTLLDDADAAAARATLGADANPNAIINGDMNIWQRGTSFAALSAGAYCVDRYAVGNTSAAVYTVSRSTDVPTIAQAGRAFNYSLDIQVTTADASVAAGDLVNMYQPIEGFNWLPLAGRANTYGAWCKAKKTGVYGVFEVNGGTDRSYVAEITINAADTWEYKTVTFLASPSAGTWNYTTGVGVYLGICFMAGSTFQTTANAWQTGNFRSTANQVNAMDNTANYFRTTGWKLEPGSVATMSLPQTYDKELMSCQRYFEKSFPYATAPAQNVGAVTGEFRWPVVLAGATVNRSNRVRFSVSKRATPTITFYNPSAANVQVRDMSLGGDCSASNASNTSDGGFEVTCTANAGSGAQNWLGIHWDASAEL